MWHTKGDQACSRAQGCPTGQRPRPRLSKASGHNEHMSVGPLMGIGATRLQQGSDLMHLHHVTLHRGMLAKSCWEADIDNDQPADVLGCGIQQKASLGK